MHDDRWKRILAHLESKYEVLERHEPEAVEGDESVTKEVIILQGQQGKTRFERFARIPIELDPLNTQHPKDWVFSERAITSYVKGYRYDEASETWVEFNTDPLFFKE